MIYNGENVLVIESKTRDECIVLLCRADLIQLPTVYGAMYL